MYIHVLAKHCAKKGEKKEETKWGGGGKEVLLSIQLLIPKELPHVCNEHKVLRNPTICA